MVLSLVPAVAALDGRGSVPIGATLAVKNGQLVACVALANAREGDVEHASFSEVTKSVLAADAPLSMRCGFSAPTLDGFRSQVRIVQHSSLCLVEVLCMAECLTGGQVQSITPIQRANRPCFHVVIHRTGAKMMRAVLDPDTCELSEIKPK